MQKPPTVEELSGPDRVATLPFPSTVRRLPYRFHLNGRD